MIISTSMKKLLSTEMFRSKWFEPRCTTNSYSVIVRVKAVLKRTVVSDYFELVLFIAGGIALNN